MKNETKEKYYVLRQAVRHYIRLYSECFRVYVYFVKNTDGKVVLTKRASDLQYFAEYVIFRINNKIKENSHKSWMNHSGPVPLITQRKYKAGCFMEASTVCRATNVLK